MMIGAPNVDQFPKMALELIPMVGDVGGEVGELAVAFDHRAVFVVAELGRSIPFGAVLRIEQAARAQFVHRALDFATLAHRLFTEEGIELDAKISQLRADGVEQRIAAILAKKLHGRFFRFVQEFIAVLLLNFGRDLRDVIARITAFGKIDFFPERLAIARHRGETEIFHLIAGVVDVIFALDIKAGGFVQARQHVADHRDPAVTDVERAGRIDAGELDLHLSPWPRSSCPTSPAASSRNCA